MFRLQHAPLIESRLWHARWIKIIYNVLEVAQACQGAYRAQAQIDGCALQINASVEDIKRFLHGFDMMVHPITMLRKRVSSHSWMSQMLQHWQWHTCGDCMMH